MKNLEVSTSDGVPAKTGTMTIQLDGRPHQVGAGSTLADLVAALGHAPEAVARHARERALAEGDAVLLFQPIVGG